MKKTKITSVVSVILSVLMLCSVMSAFTVSAADAKLTCNINYDLPDQILTTEAPKSAPANQAFKISLKPILGYKPAIKISVSLDGVELTSGYTYDNKSGMLIINAEKMVGDILISAKEDSIHTDPAYEKQPEETPEAHDRNIIKIILAFFEKIAVLFHRLFGI